MHEVVQDRRALWATIAGLTIGAIAYFLILLDFGTDTSRTAVRFGFASNIFDLQANAFLHGHLYVPPGSLSIEGFVVRGHTYTYFPPFPALVRLPVMLVTHEFDGRMTLVMMAIAWVLFATMTVKLFWLVRDLLRGSAPLNVAESIASALFIAGATGGTVVTFDAALPWSYHEVYLWAVGLVLGTLYWLVRSILEPMSLHLRWLGVFALATILTRTTGGWAVCLAIMLAALWYLLRPPASGRRRTSLGFVLAGALPLAVGIGYNYAKFRHPYLFPLQDQVWTQMNAHRREALDVNGGTITGPQFFTTSFVNYLRPDGIRFVDYFPYITLPAHPARAYDGAFLDQTYRTGSITAFSPALFVLLLLSVPAMLRRRVGLGVKALRIAVIGAVAVTGGVMGYGYVAYRYTSEFVPALVLGGAIGYWWVTAALCRGWRWLKVPWLTALASGVLFAVAANMLTGYAMAATTWEGQKLYDYVSLQERLPRRNAMARLITGGEGMPSAGSTDQLYVQGDCEAVYLNTGDLYEPWITADHRDRIAEVTTGNSYRADSVDLFDIVGAQFRVVSLQTNAGQRARVVVRAADGTPTTGPWFDLNARGGKVRVALRVFSDLQAVSVTSEPGGEVAVVPFVVRDSDFNASPGQIYAAFRSPLRRASGLTVAELPGLASPLCRALQRNLGAK